MTISPSPPPRLKGLALIFVSPHGRYSSRNRFSQEPELLQVIGSIFDPEVSEELPCRVPFFVPAPGSIVLLQHLVDLRQAQAFALSRTAGYLVFPGAGGRIIKGTAAVAVALDVVAPVEVPDHLGRPQGLPGADSPAGDMVERFNDFLGRDIELSPEKPADAPGIEEGPDVLEIDDDFGPALHPLPSFGHVDSDCPGPVLMGPDVGCHI